MKATLEPGRLRTKVTITKKEKPKLAKPERKGRKINIGKPVVTPLTPEEKKKLKR